MNVTNSKSPDLRADDVSVKTQPKKDDGKSNFSDELKNLKQAEDTKNAKNADTQKSEKTTKEKDITEKPAKTKDENGKVNNAINGLSDTLDELAKLNQKEEYNLNNVKKSLLYDDIKTKNEELGLIDNNLNLQEPQDKFNMQMNANMNFNSDGQPFAEFVKQENPKNTLNATSKDLEEEKSILSSMEENIAIANKNMAMARTKTVENEQGIKKVDKKTNLVVDTIVSYDSVLVTKEDAEFFVNLTDNGFLNIADVKNIEKSAHVSKTLADLLAKAMNDNKPIRIDFDNNISVIIKIDRAGKISADFLPSSQVAEAYLKENLPLLKQRFDENNIDYNELNQRQRKQDTQDQDNRKKGRKDE